MQMLSVSQLNRYVKAILEEQPKLADLFIKGEISNFISHTRSGHFYFTLKDENASVKAVMWKRHAQDLKFIPEDGMNVIVRASAGLYERDGSYQLYVTDILLDGEGALAVAIRQRKERLEKMGVFDLAHKKTIPPYPVKVGVITSETGAAIGDITKVISRRWPVAQILFCPVLVQGEGAEKTLISALATIDKKCDVIIIGRGGGSTEDLWAFQGEELAIAIYKTKTPVISAVGHEIDVTICDMAADLRAPTPSAAAELAVPSLEQIAENLQNYKNSLITSMNRIISHKKSHLKSIESSPGLNNYGQLLQNYYKMLNSYKKKLYNTSNCFFSEKEKIILRYSEMLDSLSPLKVLQRGYAAVYSSSGPVRSVQQVEQGQQVEIKLYDGCLSANVTDIKKADNPQSPV